MTGNVTEIIFLLDRSGSMAGLEDDTIGGFNAFVEKQRSLSGETRLTTILFDDRYEMIHDGVHANKASLTHETYYVRGMTALLDAVGRTINTVKARCQEEDQNVIFVITTDGMENASQEFSQRQIKEMITCQQAKHGWEFIFMGANIDSVQEADNIGIRKDRARTFEASHAGVQSMYEELHEDIVDYRQGKI
ncbi:hypothetical protein JNUCC1_00268 [Lentibacillus sp. JNUCC-1]|uniref:vWA domain-containing protein n=1 Tax=Lentibacillus sp. JNUCC-1 TaxID=2654513 RepID=UPI0012E83553|nr:vWA domain-containing protein [Lentibacillus sp. JNUCC-1]MUV36466.1 hypothetical protein [Lentibacillus sp. JNUCC-1]